MGILLNLKGGAKNIDITRKFLFYFKSATS